MIPSNASIGEPHRAPHKRSKRQELAAESTKSFIYYHKQGNNPEQ